MHHKPGEKTRARLLLVESDPWDAGLVQEALDELDERPHENILGRSVDLFHAESLAEALSSTASESYDLILLDLATGGTSGLHPFLRLRDMAPSTPFVILTRREEESLALTAMREGAAGYLLKEDLDCLPLARALRAAFDRQQALLACHQLPGIDELTGLTSKEGFLSLGTMAMRLANRWHKPVLLSTVRLAGYSRMEDTFGAQVRDLALIESADMMRDLFPDADLLARSGTLQFAALSVAPVQFADSLDRRTKAWVQRLTGRSAGAPVLVYETAEVLIDGDDINLSELLGAPLRQAAGMQK